MDELNLRGILSLFQSILSYFHEINKSNMSAQNILLKQKVFSSRPQTQRKIKNKEKFILANNSSKKVNKFNRPDHSQSIRQLASNRVQTIISKNNFKKRIKSKLILQFQDDQIINLKKIQNCTTKKISGYSQHVLKVKECLNKPKKQKVDLTKKNYVSVLSSIKQNKKKQKNYIKDEQKNCTSNENEPFISLHLPFKDRTSKVCENGAKNQQKIAEKGLNYGFQLLKALRRKERSTKSKKSHLNECKFVIKPFQNIKLKKCISQHQKNNNRLQRAQNQKFIDHEFSFQLDDISVILQVSTISTCPLQNQSIELLQMLNCVSK